MFLYNIVRRTSFLSARMFASAFAAAASAAGSTVTLASALALACLAVLLQPALCRADTLLALVDTGELFASDDSGASWSLRSTLPVRDAVALIAGDTPSAWILTTESGSILRSHDAGHTWIVAGAIAAVDLVALAGRTDGGILALTRTGTVWLSLDEGASFFVLAALAGSDHASLIRTATGELYALTRTGSIEESQDGGGSWFPVGSLPVSNAVGLAAPQGSVVVLTEAGTLWKSEDAGRTWVAVGTLSQVGMTGLTTTAQGLAACHRGGAVAATPDGATWSWVGSVQQLETVSLANDTPQTTGIPTPPSGTANHRRLRVWPNPIASGATLSLEISGGPDPLWSQPGAYRIGIVGADGRLVSRQETASLQLGEQSTVHIAGLASGTYYVRVIDPAGQTRTRAVTVLD